MRRKKEFPTECFRCVWDGQGTEHCLECLRRRPGNKFGAQSKCGKTVVSFDALCAIDDVTQKSGRIRRDDLHTPHSDWTNRPGYSPCRLWPYVLDELTQLGIDRKYLVALFAGDDVPTSIKELADAVGLSERTVMEAMHHVRQNFERELNEN